MQIGKDGSRWKKWEERRRKKKERILLTLLTGK